MQVRCGTLAVLALCAAACSKQKREGTANPSNPADAAIVVEVVTPKTLTAAPERHRERAIACPATRDPGKPHAKPIEGCKKDADCTEGKNGRCNPYSPGRGPSRGEINSCTYDRCITDADCTGGPCECQSYYGNHCYPGTCKVDADCGGGQFCGASSGDDNYGNCGGGPVGYFCTTAKDDCRVDADCGPKGGSMEDGVRCAYSPSAGKWTCVKNGICPVG